VRDGDPDKVVYNRVALLRADRGITRRGLAAAVGVHYQTLGAVERGLHSPSLPLALRVAEVLGVPVQVVFSTRPFPELGDVRGGGVPAPG
jgi:putative transcriptional regulator